jgi:hypothetical protein
MSSTTTHSNLSPYRAAQIMTAKGRESGKLGVDDEGKPETVEPQTMYSLKVPWRHGTARRDGGDGVYFEGEAFAEYLEAWLAGTATGGGTRKQTLQALMAEYNVDAETADQVESESDRDGQTADEAEAELEAQLAASLEAVDAKDDEPKETDTVDTGTSEPTEDEQETARELEAELAAE